ncbi:MAG: mutS2 [Bacteroidetes bacterium]|nr:mutS2 [Bacteroidota bacterium]
MQQTTVTLFDHAAVKLEFDKVLQRVQRYATSEPGKELLSGTTFSISASEIKNELSCVSEVKSLIEAEGYLPIEGTHPVRGSIQKSGVEGAILQPREVLHVGLTMKTAKTMRAFLAKQQSQIMLVWQIAEPLHVDSVLIYNIERAIDESGAVKATASKELQSIRHAINEKYDQLRKRLEAILKSVSDQGFSQDDIITTREGRMVIPVKAEHKNRVQGFIHSASSSGATVFIEPSDTLETNNDIRSLQFQEQREVERILKELTLQIGEQREQLLNNLNILARLDALQAKAKYSIEVLGVQPGITESGPTKLVQSRHPILLMIHGYQGTVPLDLELGGEYNTLVISGPNAGGKSVAMKCVGLIVLMTQAGLHIPASDQSVLRVFKKIFVDIGDEQSIENDLSTFSSHLRNLRQIALEADAESLVLIDEIGSGTDPAEGGAIAAAMLETLTKRGSNTIATTHHGALKVFAYETDGVENGAMEFDQATLTPTYRFKAGIPGSSYALEMADRLGFDKDLLVRAREVLGDRQTRLEGLITELEASAQRYRREMDELREEKTRVDGLVSQYESKIASQSKELKEIKRKALDEAREIVDNANTVIERSVREIKETGADKSALKAVRREVADLKQNLDAEHDSISAETMVAPEEPIGVGTKVQLKSGGEVGEVKSISPDGKSAVVVFGIVKMKVPVSDLRATSERQSQRPRDLYLQPEKLERTPTDIDLRGMNGEEALPLVDKFIDTATLAGLHRIDIIHGKGTGALRKKVTEFLSNHPRVKSFRLGEWNEGGTGATVVELKAE